MTGDPLARPPVPHGYAVRLALSHHLGGWKPCAGPPLCRQCVKNEFHKHWLATKGCLPAENPGAGLGFGDAEPLAATEAPA